MAVTTASEVGRRVRASAGRRRIALGDAAFYLVMALLAVAFMFPFIWTLSGSLKAVDELFDFPPPLFPKVPQFRNYAVALNTVPFALWIGNSMLVVVLATLGTVLSASVVAYSFARFKYRGRDFIFMLTLATLIGPTCECRRKVQSRASATAGVRLGRKKQLRKKAEPRTPRLSSSASPSAPVRPTGTTTSE